MIETIIQITDHIYPFSAHHHSFNVKVENLLQTQHQSRLLEEKKKLQIIKTIHNPSLINLTHIYQENLILHLLYEYVHFSLIDSLNQLNAQLQPDRQQQNKIVMKNIAYELGILTDFLSSLKIKTELKWQNFGVSENQIVGEWKIKYFMGNGFSFAEGKKEELLEHYTKEKKNILKSVQKNLCMEKKSQYLPNFIIRGNKLIFTDELSETTQRKPKSTFPQEENTERENFDGGKNFRSGYEGKKGKGKWGSKTKHKPHKNSQNFQSNIFQQEKLNRSFDDESQNISVTQTKSMKIQFQQQQNTSKKRKNSYKFRITTFQQISIDQDDPIEENYFMGEFGECEKEREEGEKVEKQEKNYKEKVNEAKAKAESVLNQYFKSKNKKNY